MNRFFLLLFCTSSLFALEEAPWFGSDLLPIVKVGMAGHVHSHVNVQGDNTRANGYALSFLEGFSIAALSLADIQLEGKETKTKQTGWGFEGVDLLIRYSLLNDLVGDPVSLMVGTSYQFATTHYLHNIDTFHHGHHAGALQLSLGKECSCGPTWRSRAWGLAEMGIADRGSPWLRGKIGYDWNGCDRYEIGAFIESLIGLGQHNIHLDLPFPGYGAISHRSVDIGLRGHYLLPCWGWLEAKVAYRVWAHNFPSQDVAAELQWIIPISL